MRWVPRLPEERANVSPGRTWVELVQLVVGGAAAIALLFWLAGLAIDALVIRISPERERALFGPLRAQVTCEAAEDRDRCDRLRRVFARLGPVSPAPLVGVHPAGEVNAFALPGGAILVTRGLLDAADDDELAFVLAHEVAHLEHRDPLRALGRVVAIGIALSFLGAESSGALELSQVTSRLALARHSRGREEAADAAAVDRLLDHGLPGSAAVTLLERLEVEEKRGSPMLAWLATHPLSERRLDAVRLAVERSPR
jgi:Zn-dependent protease with chaperone function